MTPVDAQALKDVTHEDLCLGFLEDTGTVGIVLTPDFIDALPKYIVDIPTLLLKCE